MSNTVPTIIFEHPLTEKMRTWLRIEHLIKQLYSNKIFNQNNALLFFHTLNELLEIIERSDLRAELLKEIELLKRKLQHWREADNVDQQVLQTLLERLTLLAQQLSNSSRLGLELKEDRLINIIRQRLTIPGGCCSFDLPAFHLWLNLPQTERDAQVLNWISHFAILQEVLSISLQLTRQSSKFATYQCNVNFFRENQEDAELLRIRIPLAHRVYPQVSGNKFRYTIRFVPLDAKTSDFDNNIQFELACAK